MVNLDKTKKELVKNFLKKGILLSEDIINKQDRAQLSSIFLDSPSTSQELAVLDKEGLRMLNQKKEVNWQEFEKSRVLAEKKKNKGVYSKFVEYLSSEEPLSELPKPQKKVHGVQVLASHNHLAKKRGVQDFVSFFNARYAVMEKFLLNRQNFLIPSL